MRPLSLFLLLALPALACAQNEEPDQQQPTRLGEKGPPAIIKPFGIRIGFRGYQKELGDDSGRHKVGLMTPVYIELQAGPKGFGPRKEDERPTYLTIEASDSEDVGAIWTVPVRLDPNESRVFIGYAKPGYRNAEFKVRLMQGNTELARPSLQAFPQAVGTQLYLTLGPRLPELQAALDALFRKEDKGNNNNPTDSNTRFAAYETEVSRLPDTWFGYEGIDLVILATSDREFLNALSRDNERLRALAGWVRRGGRLVVPVAPENQQEVANLLRAAAWQPPLPAVPPGAGDAKATVKRLPAVETWGEVQNKPFPAPGAAPVRVATLDPGNVPAGDWERLAQSEDNKLYVARVRYGLGQVTYLAFSLHDSAFRNWDGRTEFLAGMVTKLAPRLPSPDNAAQEFGQRHMEQTSDVASNLLATLDTFDVRVIPFAYVALFIVLYIIVVGPLDYILLRYVFKRLELTWITFPAVVLGVSVLAYFSAYAIKGNDLKVNKIDVVDIDQRTAAHAERRTAPAQIYGHSFFTILSPRIQSYTVGLEPRPDFWGGKASAGPLSADLLTWMGRPAGGPWDMTRTGSQGFFRNPYFYRNDGAGLDGVPIPVWTTKSFTATWTASLDRPPVQADLVYYQGEYKGRNVKVNGTLRNGLGVDLVDTWLIYDNLWYPIEGGLPVVKGDAKPRDISVESRQHKFFKEWYELGDTQNSDPGGRAFNAAGQMKQLLFFERGESKLGNHTLRPLDLGWHVQPESWQGLRDVRTREAILFGRARFRSGPAQALSEDASQPLPTRLWLQRDLPGTGAAWQGLAGDLTQDTYVRILLPVRPADE